MLSISDRVKIGGAALPTVPTYYTRAATGLSIPYDVPIKETCIDPNFLLSMAINLKLTKNLMLPLNQL